MSTTDLSALPVRASARGVALAAPVFVATLFLSAFLLFSVQPMFSKMVLPILGGSPSVWSVAMVFFQAMLLAGYAYAHVLTRALDPRPAALAHLAVMALAFGALPIGLAAGWGSPPSTGQAGWLVGLFLASVGPPFFAVAANGPLLQAWFARSGHPLARDPYFLYGASNVGSFVALVAYPFVVERLMTLSGQARVWTALFVLLAAGITAAALVAGGAAATPRPVAARAGRVSAGERLAWIGLAFVPSGLLVSVTAHLSTDVAAAPLLWVVPLALFLLTFVVAFRARPLVPEAALRPIQVWGTALALMNLEARSALAVTLAIHLGLFFVDALVAHRALYARRPAPDRLTDFYLTMSFGGVLGGVFAALVAPAVFSSVVEYPVLIALAPACRPGFLADLRRASRAEVLVPLVLGALAIGAGWLAVVLGADADAARIGVVVALGAGMLVAWRRAAPVAVLALVAVVSVTAFQGVIAPRETHRSFFGVMKIREFEGGQFRTLEHGTTLHGAMRIRAADGTPVTGTPEPTTYYTFEGPMGRALASVRAARGGRLDHVSVVGLGVGALACHMLPGEALTYYEIDPLVVRLATDPRLFTFLSRCAPGAEIVVGDARLTLARAERVSDVILVDAFSSDAIPVHLMTREAMALYASKLAERGVVVFHISNNFMDLRATVARAAASVGLRTYVRVDDDPEPRALRFRTPSMVAAMARDPADLGAIGADARWVEVPAPDAALAWSDDHSDILGPILERFWP